MNKKQRVLGALFKHCRERGNFVFDNELVKHYCQIVDFKNPFDATKVDRFEILPEVMHEEDGYFIIHLGLGRHQFVPQIALGYHEPEVIDDSESQTWLYKPSLLNDQDTSESNIISVCYNQLILHHFLYHDIVAKPLLYLPQRTQITGNYTIDLQTVTVQKLQMEMDAVLELDGAVTIIEGKNGFPTNFAVYQLFHPYLYFDGLRRGGKLPIRSIHCCYLQRQKRKGQTRLRLHLYRFSKRELASIELLRKAEYILKVRDLA